MLEKLNKENMPLIVAVFLVLGGLLVGFPISFGGGFQTGRTGAIEGIIPAAQGAEINDNAALNVQDASFFASAPQGEGSPNDAASAGAFAMAYAGDGAMLRDAGASLGASRGRSEIVTYIVQKRDTLASVASYFGISPQTVLAANANLQQSGMRAGEVIRILPISGTLYESGIGDTLASISNIFNVPEAVISQYNPSVNFSSMTPGTPVVIPGTSAARTALAIGSI